MKKGELLYTLNTLTSSVDVLAMSMVLTIDEEEHPKLKRKIKELRKQTRELSDALQKATEIYK